MNSLGFLLEEECDIGSNYLGGLGVERDTIELHLVKSHCDLATLEVVYKNHVAGPNVRSVDGQGRTAQDVFDSRTPLPEVDIMGMSFMLLTHPKDNKFADNTGSEAG